MPLSRYQIRNEYSLADPDLYRSADKDDPEALLEGVAMAGLVGVLRQLGDLAEFAAEIFHDLHEDVMATAARGHSLIGRAQQLEAEFPSVERRLLSQISHTSFLYNSGFDWHPNLHMDENVITRGDLPRFVMDSYEECRGPPRLFLLDKFDVAGAGACLKRYTDPSLLKVDSASSMITKSGGQREKRNRKVKRRGMRGRYGETPDVNPSSHAKLHQLLLEERIENSVNDLECRVRLKKRQLDASRFDGAAGKSYMEKFLRASSPLNTEVGVSVNPLPLTWTHKIAAGTGLEIVNIGTVSPPVARETTQADEIECSPSREEEVVKSSVHELNEISDKGIMKEAQTTYESEEEKILSICVKMVNNDELAVDADKKSESTVDRCHSDDIASEIDNYMDALATMESEVDTDTDSRTKQGQQYNIRNVVHSNGNEGREQPTPFVDTCSVGNSTMSEDGNNSLKEGHSFSYSDSVRNFSVRNPDGDGVATERSSSVASLTDHGDTYSDRLSIPEEILGSDTQEYAVDGSEGVYCVKMDEASGSLRHASLSSLVHASDLADNVKENVVYSSGVPEAISREADSVSKARKNLVSAEGYDVAEMDGGDTTKPSNGLQHQQKYSHSSEDDGQLEVSHAFGDGGSACSENADSSLPILTNGKLFSSHSLNSPAEEKNQNSALSCVDACSDAAQMHHKLIVHHFEDNGELEASNGSAGVGSACADYAKDDSLPTLMDSSSLNSPAEGKNQNLAQSSVETCSDSAQVHQASIVSMLKHEDRMKPDDTLTDEYHPIPCARVSLEKLHSPLDHALSGLVEPQCTDMSHSGLIGHPESLKESAPFSADKQSIKDASTGANAEEVVTSISPLSDNSQIQHLETDLPVEGLELDSTEHCGSHGNGPAVDGVTGVYVGQVVNGDLASLLEPCHMLSQLEQRLEDTPDVTRLSEHQLDESGNIIPANDLIVEDKSGYVHANEIKHDMNVNATESVPFSLDNVPSIIESSPPISVLQEDCIPACDHNDDNGEQKDDAAASLDFTSKGTGDTVFVSVIESNPVTEENNIEGKRGNIPPSSASECLPPSPTKMKEEALLWDEDVASKGVEIQEFPPLNGKDFGAGKVASHVVDTHMNLGSTECIVACEGHSGLRLLKDGSVSSLVRESHTDLQDNIKIANFVSSEKSGQALESSFSQRTHVMEDCIDVDYFCQPGQIQSTQQINNDDWISSTPGSAPSEGPISDIEIFPGSSQYKLNISEAQVEPLTSVLSPSADETHSTKGPEGLRQDTDQSTATTSLLDMFPNATQINMGEVPPLPPLPPMQWRLGKVLHTSLVSGGKLTQHPFGSVEATSSLPTDDNTELTSQPLKGEESQYVNPFSVPSIAENVNAQLASQTSRAWDSQYVNPFLTPSTVDNADVLAVSGSSGIQPALLDPFLVSVPPVVHPDSTPVLAEKQNSLLCLSSENGLQASEIEIDKPGLKPIDDEISIEDLASSHTSASTEEKAIQPAASVSDVHCHHITPVVDQETSISSASIEPTITMLYEQKLPGGFMVPEADRGWSAYPSDVFDAGNFNGTLQKKLPRPRNPLIDAVVALDKSKLRKVGERIKPQDVSKAKEGDGLNHVQLRKVGERVKPQDAPKPEEADLRNHVQLRRVGERVKFQDVPKREGDLRNHVQLRKVEEIVKPQDVPRPEEGDLRNHVQLRKVEETVKPQDVPKTEQGESPSHVQLRKVGDSGNRENEPNKEESRDQLLLRKAGEADKPQDDPKPDDRDSLLEQIRNKTFNLKPAAVARPSIPGPKTNLKVAAILEKASNIRQAMAGSDEDDSDGWSDS